MDAEKVILDTFTVECLWCGAKVEIQIKEPTAEAQYNSFMARHPAFCRKDGENHAQHQD